MGVFLGCVHGVWEVGFDDKVLFLILSHLPYRHDCDEEGILLHNVMMFIKLFAVVQRSMISCTEK